ncbi:MAG: hypothetical protein HYU39_01935 [Thaumarchaeota archaeon]|nr:hypothetical protein [Nitrososphaerota archaeon]
MIVSIESLKGHAGANTQDKIEPINPVGDADADTLLATVNQESRIHLLLVLLRDLSLICYVFNKVLAMFP